MWVSLNSGNLSTSTRLLFFDLLPLELLPPHAENIALINPPAIVCFFLSSSGDAPPLLLQLDVDALSLLFLSRDALLDQVLSVRRQHVHDVSPYVLDHGLLGRRDLERLRIVAEPDHILLPHANPVDVLRLQLRDDQSIALDVDVPPFRMPEL